jgi:hypothetical protein
LGNVAVLEDDADEAVNQYRQALDECEFDLFKVDSVAQQLEMFRALDYRTKLCERALAILYGAGFVFALDAEGPVKRMVPVRIWLSDQSAAPREECFGAVCTLAAQYQLIPDINVPAQETLPVKEGILCTTKTVTSDVLRRRLKGMWGVLAEWAQAGSPSGAPAEISDLSTAIGENEAIVQIGFVLLVRTSDASGGPAKCHVRRLSKRELAHLEKHQELLEKPSEILAALDEVKKDASSSG